MKLLMCLECNDVMALRYEPRTCVCGKSEGRYLDPVQAVYAGPARMLGIHNADLVTALASPDRADGMGVEFTAFVIPENAPSVTKER